MLRKVVRRPSCALPSRTAAWNAGQENSQASRSFQLAVLSGAKEHAVTKARRTIYLAAAAAAAAPAAAPALPATSARRGGATAPATTATKATATGSSAPTVTVQVVA